MSRGAGSSTVTTLVINYFVLGDRVLMTPTFMGSEPVTASTGGLRRQCCKPKQNRVWNLIKLNDAHAAWWYRGQRPHNNSVFEAFQDNVVSTTQASAPQDTAEQKEQLLDLIGGM